MTAGSGTAAASELVSSVKAGAESAGGVGERSRHVGGMVHNRTGVVIGVGPSGMSASWLESRLGLTRSRVRIPSFLLDLGGIWTVVRARRQAESAGGVGTSEAMAINKRALRVRLVLRGCRRRGWSRGLVWQGHGFDSTCSPFFDLEEIWTVVQWYARSCSGTRGHGTVRPGCGCRRGAGQLRGRWGRRRRLSAS